MYKIQRNIPLLKLFSLLEDFRFYAPVAIIYFSSITGSYTLGMSVFSVTMLTQAVMEVPFGIISDYIGRKKTLVIGSLFLLGAIIVYALSGNYTFLIFGAILEGLSRTLFSGNNNALIYESLQEMGEEKKYPDVIGKIGGFFQLGLMLSAFLGSIVAYNFGMNILFWITAIPFFGCLIVSFFVIEPKVHSEKIQTNVFSHIQESIKLFYKNLNLRRISIAGAISRGIGEAMFQFTPAFIGSVWGAGGVGIFRGFDHALALFGYMFSGNIIAKLGELRSLFLVGTGGNILGMIAFGISNIFSPVLLIISSINHGVSSTAKESLLQKQFSDSKRATMGSLDALLGTVFTAIISVLLGYLADQIGIVYALIISQFCMFIPLYIYYRLYSAKNN